MASPLPPHVKLHECHCDRQGRFWIGAYDHNFPADRATNNAIVDHAMTRALQGAITVLMTNDEADPTLGHGDKLILR